MADRSKTLFPSIGRARRALFCGASVVVLLSAVAASEASADALSTLRVGARLPATGAGAPSVAVPVVPGVTPAANAAAARNLLNATNAQKAVNVAVQAQAAARQAAAALANAVPNGLGVGGLAPATNPALTGTGLGVWQGALAPTQSTSASGRILVDIKQTESRAILSWDTFNVGANTTLNFDQSQNGVAQPDWVVLNRVVGGLDPVTGMRDPSRGAAPSQILGSITAQGTVLVINQNGVLFGGTSQINTHSFAASSLEIGRSWRLVNSVAQDLSIADRNAEFLTGGLLGVGAQDENKSSLSTFSALANADGSFGSAIEGAVKVAAGAKITAGDGGFILLTGPQVINAGDLEAVRGQVSLASGRTTLLTASEGKADSVDPNVRGFVVKTTNGADRRGRPFTATDYVLNTGLIRSGEGYVSLNASSNVGAAINEGVITATTSVARNGNVLMDGADVRLAPSSVIAITPDDTGSIPQDAVSLANFKPSKISLGTYQSRIEIGGGSLTYAPGATINVGSGSGIDGNVSTAAGAGSRIFVDSGAIIDAAGLKNVVVPASRNMIVIDPVKGNELADSPLFRNGFLNGAKIYLDPRISGVREDGVAYVGSPLISAGSYAQQIGVTASELMTKGGNVTLGVSGVATTGTVVQSAPDVIVKRGATIDISGGWRTFEAGRVKTTRLIDSTGAIVDISYADPDRTYVGIYEGYVDTQPRGPTRTYVNMILDGDGYAGAYTEGADAGSLTIKSSQPLLEGTVYADAFAGVLQRETAQRGTGKTSVFGDRRQVQAVASQLPVGGFLSIQELGTSAGNGTGGGDIVIADGATSTKADGLGYGQSVTIDGDGNLVVVPRPAESMLPVADRGVLTLGADTLSAMGLGQLALFTSGGLTVENGAELNLSPGGVFTATTGRAIIVNGDITAASGVISLETVNVGGGSLFHADAPRAGSYDVTVNGRLSTAGLWVNDQGATAETLLGTAYVDGGSVDITVAPREVLVTTTGGVSTGVDISGSILIDGERSRIDVSSGGYVTREGDLVLTAKGGDVALTNDTTYFQIAKPDSPNGAPNPGQASGFRVTGGTAPAVNPSEITARVSLGADVIKAQGFGGGGTFSLTTPAIALGDGEARTGTSLALDFFSKAGFAKYDITSYATDLSANTFNNGLGGYNALLKTQVVTVGAGQTLDLSQSRYATHLGAAQTTALLGLGTGGDITTILTPGKPTEAWDQLPVSLTFGGLVELKVAEGGRITGAPGAAIGAGQILNQGSIRLAGGAINQVMTLPQFYASPDATLATRPLSAASLADIFTINADGTIDENARSKIDPSRTNAQVARGNPIYLTAGLAADVGVQLDAGSVTDLSGVSIHNPYATGVTQGRQVVTGRVYGGGSLTTAATGYLGGVFTTISPFQRDSGYARTLISAFDATNVLKTSVKSGDLIAAPGAMLDLSGASDIFDQLQSGGRYVQAAQWSDGGSLILGGGAVLSGALIDARGGGGAAAGGTLALTNATLVQADPQAPVRNLIAADQIQASGFDNLVVRGALNTQGDVDLDLGGAFVLTSKVFDHGSNLGDPLVRQSLSPTLGATGRLDISAAYVRLDSDFQTLANPAVGTPGQGEVILHAGAMDVSGAVLLDRSVAQATFDVAGDLRFSGVQPYQLTLMSADAPPSLAGMLAVNGDLTLRAGQVYVTTGSSFSVTSSATDGVLTIARASSATPATPYSAGGKLTLQADSVIQNGVVRAPLGSLTIGSNTAYTVNGVTFAPVTRSVELGADSVTSVSAGGLSIPYGTTTDQTEYYFAPTNSDPLTAAPSGVLTLAGQSVATRDGATVDLSGGGDVYGYEFIPGPGGSRDVLSRYNTDAFTSNGGYQYADGRQVYAIVPGLSDKAAALYDPIYSADYADLYQAGGVGKRVYLDGGAGLAAGWYTLLPAQYAMLPGGMRVVEDTGASNVAAGGRLTQRDGTLVTTGRYGGLGGTEDSTVRVFQVQNQKTILASSNIKLTSAQTAFAAAAAKKGEIAPNLPADAGRLVLSALTSVDLNGRFLTTAGQGGRGGQVDISGQQIDIVSQLGTPTAGVLQLDARQLSALNADSLLIGGVRTDNADGTTSLALTAKTIRVSNNAASALSASEVVLAVDGASSSILIQDGATVTARASSAAQRTGDFVVDGAGAPTGQGALVRVASGPDRDVVRKNVEAVAPGVLTVGAATLTGASVLLDSSGAFTIDPTATLVADNLTLGGSAIHFADTADGLSGLVLTPQLRASLGRAKMLTLRTAGAIDFANGEYRFGDLTLAAPGVALANPTGAVRIVADDLRLDAGTAVTAACGAGGALACGAGQLAIDTRTTTFGDGTLRTYGAGGGVSLSASEGLFYEGKATFDAGQAALTIQTPVIVDRAVKDAQGLTPSLALVTSGAVVIGAAPGSTRPVTAGTAGANLSISGKSLTVTGTDLRATAGKMTLTATDGVTIGAGALIETPGYAKSFGDADDPYSISAPGGSLTVNALNGDVVFAAGSTVSVGGGAGKGGALTVNAGKGSAVFGGTIDAATPDGGARLAVNTAGAVDFSGLVRGVKGGFDAGMDIQTGAGDLVLARDLTLKVAHLSLVADGGAVDIEGAVDASGVNGGEIRLFGSSGVTLGSGSVLTARALGYDDGSTRTAEGGTVQLGVGQSGAISVSAGAKIDAGVRHTAPRAVATLENGVTNYRYVEADTGGTVVLRAPVLGAVGGQTMNVDFAGSVSGADSVVLEGYRAFDLAAIAADSRYTGVSVSGDTATLNLAATAAGRVNFLADTASGTLSDFIQTFDVSSIYGRLGGLAGQSNFHARPGVELNFDGSIVLASNWNFGAGTVDVAGAMAAGLMAAHPGISGAVYVLPGSEGRILADYTTMTYRVGGKATGEAGVLTLRASDDVDINGSITDGFFTFGDQSDPAFLNRAIGAGDKVFNGYLNTTCPGGCAVNPFTTGTAPSQIVTVTFPSGTSLPGVEVATGNLANPAPYNAAANSAAALGSGTNGAGDAIGSAQLFPLIETADGQKAVQSWSYQITAGAGVSDAGVFSADPTRVQAGATGAVTVAGANAYNYGGVAGASSLSDTLLFAVSGASNTRVPADQWVQAQLAQNPGLTSQSYTRLTFSSAPTAARTVLSQRAVAFFAQHPGEYVFTGPANAPTGVSASLSLMGAFLTQVAQDWSSLKTAYTPPRVTPPARVDVVTAPVIRTGTGSISLTAAGDIDLRNGATPVYRNPTTGATATATTGFQVGGAAVYTAGHLVDPSTIQVVDPKTGALLTLDPSAYSAPSDVSGVGVLNGVARNQPFYAEGGGDVSLAAGGDVLSRRDAYNSAKARAQAIATNASTSGVGSLVGDPAQPWRIGHIGMETDIRINAQLFTEGLGTLGGGDIRVRAGGDLSDISLVADTTVTTANVTGADGKALAGRALLTFGGGDIVVDVGGDMLGGRIDMGSGAAAIRVGGDLGAAGKTQLDPAAAGTLADNTLRLRLTDATIDLSVGGDATVGSISARGVGTSTSEANSLGFYSADAGVSVVADGDLTITNAWPEATSFGGTTGGRVPEPREAIYPGSLTAAALSGDLTFGGVQPLAILLYPTARGSLTLAAGGDIAPVNIAMLDADPGLLPGVFSTFRLSQFGDLQSGLPFDFPAVFSSTTTAQRRAQHNASTPHLGDEVPNRIYAGGDILNMIVSTPKETRIGAGRDIVNMMFFGQNLDARDITRIVAGRDITATTQLVAAPLAGGFLNYGPLRPALQGNTFVIGGPGTLSLEAGRDLGPFLNSAVDSYQGALNTGEKTSLVFSGGVQSVGNEWNPWLGPEGADLQIQFGVAKGADYAALRETYVDPANLDKAPDYLFVQTEDEHGVFVADRTKPIYGPKLVAWMQAHEASALVETFGTTSVSYEQAYQAFARLTGLRQRGFLQEVYFNELTQTATPGASFQKYSRGYTAVNTLFSASLGYTANDLSGGSNGANLQVRTGDLDLRLATIQTARGGDISILGPGGRVLAGSTVSTAQQAARRNYRGRDLFAGLVAPVGQSHVSAITSIPSGSEGVLTLRGGAISTFTDGDFVLNQSRLFTEQGGDVAMWSSNGDLNAGQGPKTSANFPPAVVKVSDNAYAEVDQAGAVTGAGIAAFQPAAGVAAPNVYLVAPRGTVDAGDAGVRVAGNLFVAALRVANADNFKATGTVIGVPSAPTTPVVGAETTAASTAATQAAQQAVSGRERPERSIITVEVLGFGDGECEDPNDRACRP